MLYRIMVSKYMTLATAVLVMVFPWLYPALVPIIEWQQAV